MRIATYKKIDHLRGFAQFQWCGAGNLWFRVDATGFEFPVPLDELEGAVVCKIEKAATFMKWINRHLDLTLEAREAAQQPLLEL